jgi:hypothetical protein
MPCNWYSTGSSIVTILSSSFLISFSARRAWSSCRIRLDQSPGPCRTAPRCNDETCAGLFRKTDDVQIQIAKLFVDLFFVENTNDASSP